MLHEHLKTVLGEAHEKMDKAVEHLLHELASVRAGRANPGMVENVRIDYYGTQTPINQVASISAPQPDMIIIQPWDAKAIPAIEKAIQTASMGLNPSNDGSLVRVPIPPLSEERRKDLVKTARARGEDAKVAIRNIRRHAKDALKTTQSGENLPEDMLYEGEAELQKVTDKHVERIEKVLGKKEAEILEV
jgi:ribosome recycling factor